MIVWKTVRPRGPWVVVKVNPAPETVRGIRLPLFLTEYQKGQTGTGLVLRVGGGVRDALGFLLEEGTSVLFRDFLKDLTIKELEPHEDGCRVCLLHVNDLLAVVTATVDSMEG